jgi:TatD DNase family protein
VLVDSHCHLAGDEFEADLDAIVTRARAAGVDRALVILDPTNPAEFPRIPRLRELWPELRFSVGVHPHHAGRWDDRRTAFVAVMGKLIAHQDVVLALGEIGLDYHYDFSPRDVQQAIFREQLTAARAIDLPVIIHTREADEDTLRILREVNATRINRTSLPPSSVMKVDEGAISGAGANAGVDASGDTLDGTPAGPLRGVFHCFTGDEALARGALDLGFYVSFSGIATFPKAEPLRQVARLVPADRRLVETDSPYLAPPPHRGKRNEPAFVRRVAEIVGEAVGEPLEAFAAQTTRNFDALFGRAART